MQHYHQICVCVCVCVCVSKRKRLLNEAAITMVLFNSHKSGQDNQKAPKRSINQLEPNL
jgi:hypothetical protein